LRSTGSPCWRLARQRDKDLSPGRIDPLGFLLKACRVAGEVEVDFVGVGRTTGGEGGEVEREREGGGGGELELGLERGESWDRGREGEERVGGRTECCCC